MAQGKNAHGTDAFILGLYFKVHIRNIQGLEQGLEWTVVAHAHCGFVFGRDALQPFRQVCF